MIIRRWKAHQIYTNAEAQVIAVLWRNSEGYTSAELSKLTGLWPGTLYAALAALEYAFREISSEFDDVPPPRPRRYRLAARES